MLSVEVARIKTFTVAFPLLKHTQSSTESGRTLLIISTTMQMNENVEDMSDSRSHEDHEEMWTCWDMDL